MERKMEARRRTEGGKKGRMTEWVRQEGGEKYFTRVCESLTSTDWESQVHLFQSNSHSHTHRCEGSRQSNCMSSLPVISGMSVRQVAADTVDTWCAAFIHIFYSECFQGPSATSALPPTTSNQYIINTHYARMHIYRARLDEWNKRRQKSVCGCFSESWSLSSEVSWLLIMEIKMKNKGLVSCLFHLHVHIKVCHSPGLNGIRTRCHFPNCPTLVTRSVQPRGWLCAGCSQEMEESSSASLAVLLERLKPSQNFLFSVS